MFKVLSRSAAVATIACLPFSASALNFTVTQFSSSNLGDGNGAANTDSRTDYSTIRDANFAKVFATEDFEGFNDLGQIGADNTASLSSTTVGRFTTLNGKLVDPEDDPNDTNSPRYGTAAGSGTTAVDTANLGKNMSGVNNTERGRNLSVRQDDDAPDNGGRQNTSFTTSNVSGGFDDNTYLDSNDTRGFRWFAQTANSDSFDRLLFTLTDPADQGKTLTISAGGFTKTYTIKPKQPNGEIFNVLIGFSTAVDKATISLAKNGLNDGFSIDNITVGAVPLPAAAWLLLGVSGALVGAKRRSARRAA